MRLELGLREEREGEDTVSGVNPCMISILPTED